MGIILEKLCLVMEKDKNFLPKFQTRFGMIS